MKRFPFIKRRYYLHIICFIFIVLILIIGPENISSNSLSFVHLSISSSSSVVNLSTSSPSSIVNLPSSSPSSVVNRSTSFQSSFFNLSNSYSINSSFRNELIHQRLTSYSLIYENSSRECNISTPLTAEQNESFLDISKSLDSLRQQIIPYPDEYFHGRGIVLTVGLQQMRLAKTNLKMIELTNTQLPVQVNRIVSKYK